MKPIIVTHWYNSVKVLDAALRRNKAATVTSLEWHLIYGHYPLLKSTDGVPDVRKAQNLCKELSVVWHDMGDVPVSDAIKTWALEAGKSWSLSEQQIFVVPDDSALLPSWHDALMFSVASYGKSIIRSTVRHCRDVVGMVLKDVYSNAGIMNYGTIVSGHVNAGGRISLGGAYSDELYDSDCIAWQDSQSPLSLIEWLDKVKSKA